MGDLGNKSKERWDSCILGQKRGSIVLHRNVGMNKI